MAILKLTSRTILDITSVIRIFMGIKNKFKTFKCRTKISLERNHRDE